MGHCGNVDRLGDVVEDNCLVVKGESQIRQVPVVHRRVGQMFAVTDNIIPGITDHSGHKRRQPRQTGFAAGLDPASDFAHRIFRIELARFENRRARSGDPGRRVDRDPIAISFDLKIWIGRDKAVPADLFATDHTFEKAGTTALVDFVECRDRRQRVAYQSAIDGDQFGIFGRRAEVFEVGKDAVLIWP